MEGGWREEWYWGSSSFATLSSCVIAPCPCCMSPLLCPHCGVVLMCPCSVSWFHVLVPSCVPPVMSSLWHCPGMSSFCVLIVSLSSIRVRFWVFVIIWAFIFICGQLASFVGSWGLSLMLGASLHCVIVLSGCVVSMSLSIVVVIVWCRHLLVGQAR